MRRNQSWKYCAELSMGSIGLCRALRVLIAHGAAILSVRQQKLQESNAELQVLVEEKAHLEEAAPCTDICMCPRCRSGGGSKPKEEDQGLSENLV